MLLRATLFSFSTSVPYCSLELKVHAHTDCLVNKNVSCFHQQSCSLLKGAIHLQKERDKKEKEGREEGRKPNEGRKGRRKEERKKDERQHSYASVATKEVNELNMESEKRGRSLSQATTMPDGCKHKLRILQIGILLSPLDAFSIICTAVYFHGCWEVGKRPDCSKGKIF